MLMLDLTILLLLIVTTIYFRKIIIQMQNIKFGYKDLIELDGSLQVKKTELSNNTEALIQKANLLKIEIEDAIKSSKNLLDDMKFISKESIAIMDKLEKAIINYNNSNINPDPKNICSDSIINNPNYTPKSFRDLLLEISEISVK